MIFFKQKFVFTGDEYEGSGIKIKIEREKMKALMKNYKVPDDVVEKFFGDQTTSTETDNGSAVPTTEAILTENPSMLHSISSGTGDGSGLTTTEATSIWNASIPLSTYSGTTSTATDTGGAIIITTPKASLTGSPSMLAIHHSTSSGTSSSSGNDKGEADDALLEAEAYGLLGLLKLGNITEATLTDNPSGSQK